MLWNVFDHDFPLPPALFDRGSLPRLRPQPPLPLSLQENEQGLRLVAEVPGFRAEELDLRLEGRRLSLEARKDTPDPDSTAEQVHLRRELLLPFAVEASNLSAKLDDGLLVVLLPRAAEAAPVSIRVSSQQGA